MADTIKIKIEDFEPRKVKCVTCDNNITELRAMKFPICDECLKAMCEIIKERRKNEGHSFENTKCCVCGELVTHNEGKILQPQIYVCQFCRENARQMLQIKKFATETNLKVEIKGLTNDNLR